MQVRVGKHPIRRPSQILTVSPSIRCTQGATYPCHLFLTAPVKRAPWAPFGRKEPRVLKGDDVGSRLTAGQ